MIAANLAVLLLLPVLAGPAPAGPAPVATDADELERLVVVLENDQRRAEFIADLRRLIEARRATQPSAAGAGREAVDDLFSSLARRMEQGGKQLRKSFGALLDLPSLSRDLWKRAQNPGTRDRWLEMGWKIALVLFAGLAARRLMIGLLRRRERGLAPGPSPETGGVHVVLAMLGDVLPLLVFAGVGAGLLTLLDPRPATRILALALVAAFFCERLISRIAAALLLRRGDRPPLLPIEPETAGYVYVWVRRLSIVAVYGYFTIHSGRVLGFPAAFQTLLDSAIGLLLAAMLVVFVMQNREPVAAWIRGPSDAPPGAWRAARAFFAGIWAIAAVLGIVAAYGIWLFSVEGGFRFLLRATLLSLLAIAVARLAVYLVGAGLHRGFRISPELRLRYPELERRVNRYVPLIERLARFVIYAAAVLAIIDLWGFGVYGWLESDAGTVLTAKVSRIVIIIVSALAVWEIVSALIHRYLERQDPASGALLPVSPRARTLLPVAQNLALIVIGAMAGISMLSELGINIAPLLAGAGVVGLAIGVGAQSLVKDVITGIFIILEDSLGLGDIADVAGHVGVVEGMTIRTLRIRDADGVVHTIPFGSITDIRNLTRDFAFSVADVNVGYDADVDEVIRLLEEVGTAMRADRELAALILEPMEVLGLESFGESSLNIRVRFKTEPASRWQIRREFNRRVKRVFDEHGIQPPYPRRTIHAAGARGTLPGTGAPT